LKPNRELSWKSRALRGGVGAFKVCDFSRLLNRFQPYVDLFSHLALFLEASSLRDRIVLCHDKLADALLSLLRQRGLKVSKVNRALRVARQLNIISERVQPPRKIQ